MSDRFTFERWTPRRSGSLYGFAVVRIGSLRVSDIRILKNKDGGFFAAMPSTSWTARDGKVYYNPIVEFPDKGEAKRFSDALVRQIAAIDHDIIAPPFGDATVTPFERRRTDEPRNDTQPGPYNRDRRPAR